MKELLLIVAAVMVCSSCGGGKAKKSAAGEGAAMEAVSGQAALSVTYAMPKIPALLTEPAEQADWAARHFWDGFDFTDTLGVERWSDYAEQAFVDYTQLLFNIPRGLGDESIGILFRKAAVDKAVFQSFTEIAEKYLFDANSPYRDDEYYITVLNSVLANPSLDQWERVRPQEQLSMSMKNRLGEPAADFRYTLASGTSGTLYGLKAPYVLLFFNNPGCPACRQTQEQITGSQFLSRLVSEGKLAVLAVYPDEDVAAWREYAANIPSEWINSYDAVQKLKAEDLYDLKAIPTLYLLGRDKKVMLKDVMSVPLIEETIYNDLEQ